MHGDINFAESLRANYKLARARLCAGAAKNERVGACEVWQLIYPFPIGPVNDASVNQFDGIPTVLKNHGRRIIAEFCAEKGVDLVELVSHRRFPKLVSLRHELMWRLRTRTAWSLHKIGQAIGGRDHTTVLHGIRRYQRRLEAAQ